MVLITAVICLALFAGLEAFPQPPQPSCMRACAWCERTMQPLLQEISQRCPLCACAARNSSCPAPQPPARFCLQGNVKDSRGCDSERCKPVSGLQSIRSMLQDCPKTCPGGFQRNETSGLPVCDCVCPLERLPPMERTQRCAQTCRGFTFTTLFNPHSGCTECTCGNRLPVPNCLQFACPLYCPLGYELGPQGCPECRCKEPKDCPAAPKCDSTCLVGPQRDPFTGCVSSCDCADPQQQYCPFFGCNADCGPHKLANVFDRGCQVGCKCQCKALQCPEARSCLDPVRDQFGCPTCQCKQVQVPVFQPLPTTAAPPCQPCGIDCPSGMRQFNSSTNCEICECCPDVWTLCPLMDCRRFATDAVGCPTCACAADNVLSDKAIPSWRAQKPRRFRSLAFIQNLQNYKPSNTLKAQEPVNDFWNFKEPQLPSLDSDLVTRRLRMENIPPVKYDASKVLNQPKRISKPEEPQIQGKPMPQMPENEEPPEIQGKPMPPMPQAEEAQEIQSKPMPQMPEAEEPQEIQGKPMPQMPEAKDPKEIEGKPMPQMPEAEGPQEIQGKPMPQMPEAEEPQEIQGKPMPPIPEPEGPQEIQGKPMPQMPEGEEPQEIQGKPMPPMPEAEGPQEVQGKPMPQMPEPEGPQQIQGKPMPQMPEAEEPQEIQGKPMPPMPEAEGPQDIQGKPMPPMPEAEGPQDIQGKPMPPMPEAEGPHHFQIKPLPRELQTGPFPPMHELEGPQNFPGKQLLPIPKGQFPGPGGPPILQFHTPEAQIENMRKK